MNGPSLLIYLFKKSSPLLVWSRSKKNRLVNVQATEGINANIEIHPNVTLSASDLTALCRLQGLTAGSLDDDFWYAQGIHVRPGVFFEKRIIVPWNSLKLSGMERKIKDISILCLKIHLYHKGMASACHVRLPKCTDSVSSAYLAMISEWGSIPRHSWKKERFLLLWM